MFNKSLFIIISLTLAINAKAQIDSVLHKNLLVRFDSDQAVRTRFITNSRLSENLRSMTTIDSDNTAFLKEEVRKHGWPSLERVSANGVSAAFFIVQHSPDYAFQKRMLPVLEAEADHGRISKQEVAMLLDRVLVFDHEPQLYGSQFKEIGSVSVPFPILDEDNVDERRLDVGMVPIGLYSASLNYEYHPTVINFGSLVGQIVMGTGTILAYKLCPF
jgi:hypothetical protein